LQFKIATNKKEKNSSSTARYPKLKEQSSLTEKLKPNSIYR